MNQLIHLAPMKSSIFSLLLMISFSSFSQSPLLTTSTQFDFRLYDVFEKEYLEKIEKEDLFLIQKWTFYLDNAFFISDKALGKNDNETSYPSVSIPNLDQINILKLEKEQNLKHDFYTETIFKIEGTGKFLVYLAGRDFIEKFNTHMKMMRDKSKSD